MRGGCRVRGRSPGQDKRTARCAWGLFQQHEMLPLGKDAIREPQKPRAADPVPMNYLDPSSNVMIKTVPKALDFCGSLGSKWNPQLRVAETQRGVSGSPSWECSRRARFRVDLICDAGCPHCPQAGLLLQQDGGSVSKPPTHAAIPRKRARSACADTPESPGTPAGV